MKPFDSLLCIMKRAMQKIVDCFGIQQIINRAQKISVFFEVRSKFFQNRVRIIKILYYIPQNNVVKEIFFIRQI